MLKNYLVSKISVLFLTKIVLNSLIIPAWSAKTEEEKDQNSNSAITVRTSNDADKNDDGDKRNNTSIQDYFSALSLELKIPILEMVAFDLGAARKGLSHLALVCKDWDKNIINNTNPELNTTLQNKMRQSWIHGRCE